MNSSLRGMLWSCSALALGTAAQPGVALDLGVRGGTGGADLTDTGFDRYEVFVRDRAGWSWRLGENWEAQGLWSLSAGQVETQGIETTVVGLGPSVRITQPGRPWGLDLGIALSYFGDDQLDGRDLGGAMQFTSHLGLYYELGSRWGLGYRVHHTSNGSLYDANDGLNMQMLELWYRWR